MAKAQLEQGPKASAVVNHPTSGQYEAKAQPEKRPRAKPEGDQPVKRFRANPVAAEPVKKGCYKCGDSSHWGFE